MKKLFTLLLFSVLLVLTGCAGDKKDATPAPQVEDTSHLTGEDKGLIVSTSRDVRDMTQMIKPTKQGHDVVSLMVKVENNTKSTLNISPDFISIKTEDGATYKYAASLTNARPLGKSAFIKRTIPHDYRGGGLLLFEIKSGSTVESLNYKDDSGHNITLKYRTEQKKNNI